MFTAWVVLFFHQIPSSSLRKLSHMQLRHCHIFVAVFGRRLWLPRHLPLLGERASRAAHGLNSQQFVLVPLVTSRSSPSRSLPRWCCATRAKPPKSLMTLIDLRVKCRSARSDLRHQHEISPRSDRGARSVLLAWCPISDWRSHRIASGLFDWRRDPAHQSARALLSRADDGMGERRSVAK